MTSYGSDLILARLRRLHPRVIDLSLGRIERLLARLGHPERRLPPVVHVAGTNGKGSLLAMLDAMVRAAGRPVHRYTSPHLVRFGERIRLDGREIGDAELAATLEEAERANAGEPITEFEITTAAALLAFARHPADLLLLEVGLGGRLDATNVVARPLLTALTPVSMDHQAFLGDTLEAIAFEKAGVLKPGVPCVVGPQDARALAVIEARAAEVGAPLLVHGRDWDARAEAGGGLRVETRAEALDLPPPALLGAHQIDNAGAAVVSALNLGPLRPDPDAIAAGLRRVEWPARLQRLRRGPLAAVMPEGSELWLDGGHNPAAGEALARSLAAESRDPRPLHLIFGMLSTKDARGFLAPLAPLVRSLRAVPVPDEPASRDPAASVADAAALGVDDAAVAASVEEALRAVLTAAGGRPCRILICGSLYLAGHVLRENG